MYQRSMVPCNDTSSPGPPPTLPPPPPPAAAAFAAASPRPIMLPTDMAGLPLPPPSAGAAVAAAAAPDVVGPSASKKGVLDPCGPWAVGLVLAPGLGPAAPSPSPAHNSHAAREREGRER
jgi:hypothetical protein